MSVDLSNSNYTLVDVVGSRVKLTRRGGEYTGLCPFHDDHNPSFYVIPSKGFCHCFSCGWNGDAIDFLRDCDGLSYKEAQEMLFGTDWKAIPVKQELGTRAPSRLPWKSQRPPEGVQSPASFATKSLGTPVGVWCYRDKDGFPLGYCTRYDVGDPPNQRKVVLQWTYGHDANETLRWACRHFSKPRPLYGLDRLEARQDAQVIVVEGEKAADAASTLFPGAVAVTWPGGSNAPSNVDWSPLYGRRVVVIPDADEPGREAARFICARLATNGSKVSYVNPEAERPAGWDLADALEDGWLSSEALDWAKQNKHSYDPKAKNPIPAPQAQAPNPAKEDTHKGDQLEAPPIADTRPRLAAVDGENLPPFPPDDTSRDDLPPEFSDVAISKSLVKQYGENWRFCAEWGKWFEWNGQAWRPDTKKHIFTLARKVCVQTVNVGQGALLTDAAKRSINSHKTHFAVVTVTGYDETIAIGTDLWDQDPWILSTPDGVINLKTGEKRKARREDYSTKLTLVGPKGKCPLWMDFLKRVTAGDEELEAYLQRLSGYSLTGVVDEHIFAFFYGEGGNGKGTFLRTLRTIMQDYACAASIDTFTESKGERHETELAMLRGARLCVAQETDEGRRWAESRIKALTGGDPVRARFMRQDYFEYKPEFKLIFAGNKKPGLRSVDDAMRRRVHIVPWVVKIPPEEIDHQLEEKFIPEYPGILKWMVDGCLKWQKEGINPPQCVLDATQEYLETEDALLAWLEECCELSALKNETTKLIYKSYCEYCNKSGERPWSQKRLVQNLQTRGIETTRVAGIRMLEGIRLTDGEHKRLSGGVEENWWDN